MLSNIKSVIFDIGGVLVDLDYERCISSFREMGFEDAADFVSCYHPAKFFGELERGEISITDFCDEIRKLSVPELSDEQICDTYCSLLEGIPIEKLRLMESLRSRGFRLFALSNMSPIMIKPILEYMRADGRSAEEYFDKMFLSFEMGVMKPDRRIYEMLIDQTGIDPSQTLFIDDSVKNIEMGREMGMQVYLASEREDFSHLFE